MPDLKRAHDAAGEHLRLDPAVCRRVNKSIHTHIIWHQHMPHAGVCTGINTAYSVSNPNTFVRLLPPYILWGEIVLQNISILNIISLRTKCRGNPYQFIRNQL